MKELSIEDKAKAYDEAIERATKWYDANTNEGYRGIFEDIFPELKESEDERILKQLRDFFKNHINSVYEEIDDNNDVLTWLEKQGEKYKFIEKELMCIKGYREKAIKRLEELEKQGEKLPFEMKTPEESLGIDSDTYNKIVDECIYGEQKPEGKTALEAAKEEKVDNANKIESKDYSSIDPHFFKTTDNVEPKFHEGDWITNGDYTWKIVEVKPLDYILQSQDGNIIVDTISYVDEQFHSFTIQDAKPGDVFVNQNGEMPFIFKECKNNHIYCYCGYTNRKDIFFDRFVDSEGEELHWLNLYHEQAYPAIKEQRDTLFAKMKEVGYEWDAKKKELKKIEQKPAWSEEDELMLVSIIQTLKLTNGSAQMKIDWLKSLKERILPKSIWSEEDEVKMNRIVACLENLNVADNDILLKDVDWLKSLMPQSQWKPSDEQIEILDMVLTNASMDDNIARILRELREQLKKLKG